jgi:hypothetical protein
MTTEIDHKKDAPENPSCPQGLSVERQTYTVAEASKILGICLTLAYRPGVLPTVRVAGRLLVPRQALERILAGAA